jgi:hypothetical protein
MKRTLIQFDEETYEKLRRRAFEEGRSISAVTRELVELGLEPKQKRKIKKARQLSFVGSGRSRQGDLTPVSERHDEALLRKEN